MKYITIKKNTSIEKDNVIFTNFALYHDDIIADMYQITPTIYEVRYEKKWRGSKEALTKLLDADYICFAHEYIYDFI